MGSDETNADRIDKIRRGLPPAKGVRSGLGYASLDELARLLGTNRSLVITWTRGAEPSEKHRRRLAELSRGVYEPDDFRLAVARRARDSDVRAVYETVLAVREEIAQLQAVQVEQRQKLGRIEVLVEQLRQKRGPGGQARASGDGP